jgi:fatty acid kinase fatty acid binding subunit
MSPGRANQEIAIVTDSTADIPQSFIDQLSIVVVPNIIIMEGKSLEDGKDITRQEFYEKLPTLKELPTTATSSSGAYEHKYRTLISQGFQHIISIHASSLLSGIYNAARLASTEFKDKVTVLDSQQLTLALGFQVIEAAEAAQRGESLQDVLACIESVRQRVRLIAMLDTLEYVRRSGRVSWARARLGELFHIKAFVEVKDGQVFSLGEARTYQKGLARLKQLLLGVGTIERLAILHSNAEGQAKQFISELPEHYFSNPLIVNVTTVIGTHIGPNGIGFAAVLQ